MHNERPGARVRTALEAVLGPVRTTRAGQTLLQLYRAPRDPAFARTLRHGTRAERFTYIYEFQKWGPLGAPSTLRRQLSVLLAELEINSIFDAGCGDFNWMKDIPYAGSYIGADIVPSLIDNLNTEYGDESHRFATMDVTEDLPPTVDLIVCRDVLLHLPNAEVAEALRNFRASGSRWLLVSTYSKTRRNWDIEAGGQHRLNLERPPFSLPRPQRYLVDKDMSQDWRMNLYRLEDLSV